MVSRATDACGIVLAGGRSRRFGGDKLIATIGDRPLLSLAVDAVSTVCDEVVVAVASGYRPPMTFPEHVRTVVDIEPDGGPLTGLLTGAMAAHRERLLVVAGDMPLLVVSVLRMLLEALGSSREAAALGWGQEDTAQPLPLALRRTAALVALETSVEPGRGSLRSLLGRLDIVVIPEPSWRTLDPDGATLRDVDRPEDLPPVT